MFTRMGKFRLLVFVALALLTRSAAWAGEFRVNSSTMLPCSNATVGMDCSGNFVAAWEYQDNIGVQRFGLDGTRLGAEEVWPGMGSPKSRPSVARNPGGNYIISWKEQTTETAIWVELFGPSGNSLHPAGQVATLPAGDDPCHSSIIAPSGNFAVTWTDWSDPSTGYVCVRRYDSAGNAITPDLVASVGFCSSGAYDSAGSMLLAWTDPDSDVYVRGYDSDGLPHGAAQQANTGFGDGHYLPSVTSNGDMFMVAWVREDSGGTDIYARRFNESGTPIGRQFLVNSSCLGNQLFPQVASSASGDFLITWQGPLEGDENNIRVFARRFDAAGYPIDDEFPVSEFGTWNWPTPDAAMDDSGNFIITWEALEHEGEEPVDTYNIYAKRYAFAGDVLDDAPFSVKVPEPLTIFLLVSSLAALALRSGRFGCKHH